MMKVMMAKKETKDKSKVITPKGKMRTKNKRPKNLWRTDLSPKDKECKLTGRPLQPSIEDFKNKNPLLKRMTIFMTNTLTRESAK